MRSRSHSAAGGVALRTDPALAASQRPGKHQKPMSIPRTNTCIGLALCLMFSACSSPRPAEPSGDPYVRGAVETISTEAAAATIFVRAGPGSREPCGIFATTDSRTSYFRRDSAGDRIPATLSALQLGDTVEVFVTGPVMESCPVQGYASMIVVLAGPNLN